MQLLKIRNVMSSSVGPPYRSAHYWGVKTTPRF